MLYEVITYFQQHRTGDIMSRATNDLAAVRMMLGPGLMYAVNTLAVGTAAVFLMLKKMHGISTKDTASTFPEISLKQSLKYGKLGSEQLEVRNNFV